MKHGNSNARSDSSPKATLGADPVEQPSHQGHPASSGEPGPEAPRAPTSDDGGPLGEGLEAIRDPLRNRHRSGVPGQREVDPTEVILQAFLKGDPEAVYAAAMDLSAAYREVMAEAARLRFQVNFGSKVCDGCDGLRAGPGVLATCFQVKRCNFTNIKEGSESPIQQRLIQGLSASRKV